MKDTQGRAVHKVVGVVLAVASLAACSSPTSNDGAGSGGASTGGVGGTGGGSPTGGSGGSGGTEAGGASGGGGVSGAGVGGVAGAGGAPGDAGITPKCTAQAAITKLALSKVTWVWQSYSDQKLSTNQCIACAESPCDAVCQIMPIDIWWEDPWWFRAEATCSALTKIGTCGSENQCQMTFKAIFVPRATLVPTPTGWKVTQLKGNSAGTIGYAAAPSACGSGWAMPEPLWNSTKPGLMAAFEGAEFPCP